MNSNELHQMFKELEDDCTKTHKKLDAYIKCVNMIDDYIEYSCRDVAAKDYITKQMDQLVEELVTINQTEVN